MKNDITFLIQARLGSTRLAKKVLKKIYTKTLIEGVYKRINHQNTIVLTSINSIDDDLVKFCKNKKMNIHRGDELNVFNRFLDVVKSLKTPYFARITGDNPFVETSNYLKMLQLMKKNKLDRILNVGLPLGSSFEILTKESFIKQSKETIDDFQKEHVTSKYYQNLDTYSCGVYQEDFKEISHLRLTIDEQLDLDLIRNICKKLNKETYEITMNEINNLYKKNKSLFSLNQNIKQKNT
ncbi:MAG: hypothetical protein COB02_13215 [Candidatus Cloacimonadota bacterium]|nr:MAG: hypothetical protein COB02_13215 [Candidatus Cloacimonadota bacterium]